MELNNNLLNNALEKAIKNHGTDVLKSPHLVNILQDYGAFNIHDCNSSIAKRKLSDLINKGEIEEILSWRDLSKERQQRKWQKLLV